MDQVARPVLVFELTESGFLVGLVIAARMAPNLILGMFAGSLVDRYPRRNVLVLSQFVNALTALALVPLLLSDVIEAWHVIALVAVQGVNIAFFQPARQAVLPSLVPPAMLRSAVAMSQTAQHSMRIVGGVIGGILLAVTSFEVIYLIMAICYGVAILLLWAMRADTRAVRSAEVAGVSIWQSTKEGARWAIEAKHPLAVVLVGATMFMIVMPYQSVFLPILVLEELDRDRAFVGYLAAATGVGAVVGSFAIASLRNLPNHGLVMLGLLAFSGVLLIALAASPWLALIAVVLAVIGGSNVAFMSLNNLTMLSLAPDTMAGRAMSLMNFGARHDPAGGPGGGSARGHDRRAQRARHHGSRGDRGVADAVRVRASRARAQRGRRAAGEKVCLASRPGSRDSRSPEAGRPRRERLAVGVKPRGDPRASSPQQLAGCGGAEAQQHAQPKGRSQHHGTSPARPDRPRRGPIVAGWTHRLDDGGEQRGSRRVEAACEDGGAPPGLRNSAIGAGVGLGWRDAAGRSGTAGPVSRRVSSPVSRSASS